MGLRQPSFARVHRYDRKSVSHCAALEALEGSRAFQRTCLLYTKFAAALPLTAATVLSSRMAHLSNPRVAVHCKWNKHEEEKSHRTSQQL